MRRKIGMKRWIIPFLWSARFRETTMAMVIANEMNVNIRTTSGPAIERAGDLVAI